MKLLFLFSVFSGKITILNTEKPRNPGFVNTYLKKLMIFSLKKIMMKRTLWIYCSIIILAVTGFLLAVDTKNKINHKSELADKAFEQICRSYEKRLSLAKQIFPDTLKSEEAPVPVVQPASSGSDGNDEHFIYSFVRSNMLFQRKLDSMIMLASDSEESYGLIEVKLKNNAKEIYRLKASYHKYAKDYNTFIKQFPRNYYANILSFPPKVYYDID